jgi:pyruvate/oxaloacetate carboxyltransferase
MLKQEEDVLTRALFPGPSVEFFKYRNAKRTRSIRACSMKRIWSIRYRINRGTSARSMG